MGRGLPGRAAWLAGWAKRLERQAAQGGTEPTVAALVCRLRRWLEAAIGEG